MPPDVRDAILRSLVCGARGAGRFWCISFRARPCRICARSFGSVELEFEPLNVLPATLFLCAAVGGGFALYQRQRQGQP